MAKIKIAEIALKAISALIMAALAIIKFIGYIVKMKPEQNEAEDEIDTAFAV